MSESKPMGWIKRLKYRFAWMASHWCIGFTVLAALLIHYMSNDPLTVGLRNWTFDQYQNIAPREATVPEGVPGVTIVDLDDATLEEIGQWPWPRTLVAEMVNRMTAMGAMVIGFDIVFAEKDRLSPDNLAEQLPGLSEGAVTELKSMPSNEAVLAGAIANGRVVVGQVGTTAAQQSHETLAQKVGVAVGHGGKIEAVKPFLGNYPVLIRNLPELEQAADGIGLFSTLPDDDGVYRRVALMERVGDRIYPALSLEMLRVALGGQDSYQINLHKESSSLGIKEIIVRTGDPNHPYIIPTDQNARVWVHFARHMQPGMEDYDPAQSIYLSAKDILQMTEETRPYVQGKLRNRLVIIGTSATGLKDIRPTPIDGKMPGAEVHAQLLETILAQAYLERPWFAKPMEMGMILLGGLMMILLVPRLNAALTFLFAAAQIGAQCWIAWHFYTQERVLIDASYPALALFVMFMVLSYLNYMREEKQRAQIKHAFGHYVSPALLEELAEDPDRLVLGGETRDLTVLFSDIRGFTTISEQFDAQGLTQFINKFLTPMTDVIMDNKGTIDKYMGDAIMAFWNAPVTVADHPKLACKAALEMLDAVSQMNADMKEKAQYEGRRHIPIAVGVGINTDSCCVGNMGSDQRFDYSALGDGVNLASRLEGQSKTYGVDIVIGENTKVLLDNEFAVIELDRIQVKGKTEPVTIFGVLGDGTFLRTPEFQRLAPLHEQMLMAYRMQDWQKSLSLIEQCLNIMPQLEGLYGLYVLRIKDYLQSPPPAQWDGVFVATSK